MITNVIENSANVADFRKFCRKLAKEISKHLQIVSCAARRVEMEIWKDQDCLAEEWTSENAPSRTSKVTCFFSNSIMEKVCKSWDWSGVEVWTSCRFWRNVFAKWLFIFKNLRRYTAGDEPPNVSMKWEQPLRPPFVWGVANKGCVPHDVSMSDTSSTAWATSMLKIRPNFDAAWICVSQVG